MLHRLIFRTSKFPQPGDATRHIQLYHYHSSSLADLGDMEYRPIIARGHFIHEKEIYMGPRSYMSHGDSSTKSSLMSENSDHIGYLVITPFKLEGRE